MKTVSVVMPIYNGEKFLDRSITSVLNQTYSNLELLLIDDCSKDGSLEICRKYVREDKRVKLFPAKTNGGTICANLYLYKDYLKDYVMCIDQDDWMSLDMVGLMLKTIDELSADIVVCDYVINENTPSQPGTQDMLLDNTQAMEQLMLDGNIKAYFWNKIYRKDIFVKGMEAHVEDIEVFDDFVTMPFIFQNAEKVKLISNKLYHYYINPDSFSLSTNRAIRDYYLARSYWHRFDFLEKYYVNIDSDKVVSKAFSNSLGAWRMLKKEKKNEESKKLLILMKSHIDKLKNAKIQRFKKILIRGITL